jgi:glyoxylase-like metal-dependent hydrolase (beta-lactamase superfamily II)
MTRTAKTVGAAAAALLLLSSAGGEAQKPKTPKARALPAGVSPFEIAMITSGSWYGRFGLTNQAWIDLGEGVLVVDTGGTLEDAANLQSQIKETTKGKPVKWIVLTHLHGHSNNGLKSFLPTDATIFVNARVAGDVALAFQARDPKAKSPIVMGVSDHSAVVIGGRRLEFGTPPASAASIADLMLFDPSTGVAYVGDLLTPGHCPLMSDPVADPKGWLSALDAIQAYHPAAVVATDGDASKLVENELAATRNYITRILDIIADLKKKGLPEARVASELQLRKLGDYCPVQRDSGNAVPFFRRANAEGVVQPPAAPAPAPAPPKKKS